MTEKRVRHLPVVARRVARGVISIGDLVKHVISVQSATLEHLERYISGGYTGYTEPRLAPAARPKLPDRLPAHDRSHRAAL